jgi:hypothetical protein
VVEAEVTSRRRRWRWLVVASLAGAVVAIGLGFVSFSSGVVGQGGTECGSVWKVSANYAGCTDQIDAAAFAVFAGIGLSVCSIIIGVMHARRFAGWATLFAVISGITIAALGPGIWRERRSSSTSATDDQGADRTRIDPLPRQRPIGVVPILMYSSRCSNGLAASAESVTFRFLVVLP